MNRLLVIALALACAACGGELPPDEEEPPGVLLPPPRTTSFDCVAALGPQGVGPATVRALVEDETALQVVAVRRARFEYTVLVFAPASPVRDEAAHRELVDRVSAIDGIDFATGDCAGALP